MLLPKVGNMTAFSSAVYLLILIEFFVMFGWIYLGHGIIASAIVIALYAISKF